MAVVHPTREAYSRDIDELFAPHSGSSTVVASPGVDLTVDLERLFTAPPARRNTEPLAEPDSDLEEINEHDLFLDENEEEEEEEEEEDDNNEENA